MDYNLQMIGENVHLAYVGTPSSTSSAGISILDANGNARTLQSYERLVIDDLVCDIASGSVDLLNAAAGAAATSSTNLLTSFNTTVGLWTTDKEGMACLAGTVPSLLSSNGTASVKLSGSGRIVEAGTQGVRPSWKESTIVRGL